VGSKELSYVVKLELALRTVKKVLSSNNQPMRLNDLVETALLEKIEDQDGTILDRQSYGDAILHGCAMGSLKMSLTTEVELLNVHAA
jgi:hypothetical protein